jgi:hypothetical protein
MITKELLYDLYFNKKLTTEQISKIIPCSTSTVSKYFYKYGFKFRTRIAWNKGIKAKDDVRVARFCDAGHKANESRIPWNYGLTKETSKSIANVAKEKELWHSKHDTSGNNNPFYGKKHSEDFRKKQSLNKGGTGIPYSGDKHDRYLFNEQLKNRIRTRDYNTCQICKLTSKQLNKKLDIHHINYNKLDCSESNLISLCKSCHSATNSNRLYWKEVLTKKVLS